MRPYETAFLIAPNLPDEDNEKLIDQMAEVVSKKKGKMLKVDKWGKRRLAYPIQKFEEAYYVFFLYEGEPAVLTELERRFKQTEAILRYLTVRTEVKESFKQKGKPAPKRKKKETAAKEEPPPSDLAPEAAASDDSPPDVPSPAVEEPQEELPVKADIKEEA